MTEWVIEERKTTGERHRKWRATSILHVRTERQALMYYQRHYLDTPIEPGWRSRLVRVEEVRTVLLTERAQWATTEETTT